jgi:hypothetical protein
LSREEMGSSMNEVTKVGVGVVVMTVEVGVVVMTVEVDRLIDMVA